MCVCVCVRACVCVLLTAILGNDIKKLLAPSIYHNILSL